MVGLSVESVESVKDTNIKYSIARIKYSIDILLY